MKPKTMALLAMAALCMGIGASSPALAQDACEPCWENEYLCLENGYPPATCRRALQICLRLCQGR